jgi:hypothetical protein
VYIHPVDRFEKRGKEGLKSYDPAATDRRCSPSCSPATGAS